jgi:hypothetical protein
MPDFCAQHGYRHRQLVGEKVSGFAQSQRLAIS